MNLCERVAETGCTGYTPPGRETYICERLCRLTLTEGGGVEPLWPDHPLRQQGHGAAGPERPRS